MSGETGQSPKPEPLTQEGSPEEKVEAPVAGAPTTPPVPDSSSPGKVDETRVTVAAAAATFFPSADEQSDDGKAGASDTSATTTTEEIDVAFLSELPPPPETNTPGTSHPPYMRRQTSLPPPNQDPNSPAGGFAFKLLLPDNAPKLDDSKSRNSAGESSLAGSDDAASDDEPLVDVTWVDDSKTKRPMADFGKTVVPPDDYILRAERERGLVLGKKIPMLAQALLASNKAVADATPISRTEEHQMPDADSPTYTPQSRQLPPGKASKESPTYDQLMPLKSVIAIAQILGNRVAEAVSPDGNSSSQPKVEAESKNELAGLTGEELRRAAENLLDSNPKKLLRLSPHLFGQPYAFEYIKLAVALYPGYALECTPYYHPEMRREILKRALPIAAEHEAGPFFENAHLWLPFSDDAFSEKLFSLAVRINDGNWSSAGQFLFNAPKYRDKAFTKRIAASNQQLIVKLQDMNTDLFLHYLDRFFDLIDESRVEKLMALSARRRPIKMLERFPVFAKTLWSGKILGAIIDKDAPAAFDYAITKADDVMAKMILEAFSQKNSKLVIQRFKEYEKRPFAPAVFDFAFDKLKEEDPAAAFELAVLHPDKEKVSQMLTMLVERKPKAALVSCRHYSSEPCARSVRKTAATLVPGFALGQVDTYEEAYKQEVIINAAPLAAESDTETFFMTVDRWLPTVDAEFGEKVLRQARKNNSMAALKNARKYASFKPFGLPILKEAAKQVLAENPVGILQNFPLFGDLLEPEEAKSLVSAAAKMHPFPALENFPNYENMPFANDILRMIIEKDQVAAFIFAVKTDDEIGQKIMEIFAVEYPKETFRSYPQFKNKPWAKQTVRIAADVAADKDPRTLVEFFPLIKALIKGEADAEEFLVRAIKSDPIPVLFLFENYINEPYGLNIKELAAEEAKVRYPEDTMRVAYVFAGDSFAAGIIRAIAEDHPDLALKYAANYAGQPYALPILLEAAAANPKAAYEYGRECGQHELEVLRVAMSKMDLK